MTTPTDKILTSESGKRMLTYVAPIYNESRNMLSIFQANGDAVDDLQKWTKEIRDQMDPMTATWGLKYWEQRYNIPIDETKPIRERREYIQSRRKGVGTPTPKLIKDTAQAYTNGEVEVIEASAYTFKIRFISQYGVPSNIDQFYDTISKLKQAHMSVIYEFSFLTCAAFDAAQITAGDFDDLRILAGDLKTTDFINLNYPRRSIALTFGEQ